jgi:ribosomal protein L22
MAEPTEYAKLTVDELKAELEKRELPKSGKKDELIARLEDDDTAQGGTAPESAPEAAEETTAPAPPAASPTAAGRRRRDRDEGAREAPRDKSGAVAVRAQAKYVRSAPRKARLVMDHIRGKDVAQARAILRHTPRAAATDIAKLLESAVANAENNFELDPDDLKIGRAFVDEGPTIKRYRPRALGRATRINKRTSHMTITLTTSGKDA